MELKKVNRDGIPILKVFCPECHTWADIDDDQYHGRVSILCDCGFHTTCDFSKAFKD